MHYNNKIDKIMKEYLENKKTIEEIAEGDNLIVNFDITYTDGRNKSFTVNSDGNLIDENDIDKDTVEELLFKNNEDADYQEGEITVYSTIRKKDGTKIRGVKVNLYRINGVTPKLVQSLETDCDGKVIFSGISDGSYRVIEFIDRRYFDKPTYIDWNEVTIDCDNKEKTIYAINTIRRVGKKAN